MENGELKMENVIVSKSFEFAVKIVRLFRELRDKGEFELASQILRSGTSIGANVNEAQQAQSRKDFVSKMSIAVKEAYETRYWLQLLNAVETLDDKNFAELSTEIEEIIKILVSIVKTAKTS